MLHLHRPSQDRRYAPFNAVIKFDPSEARDKDGKWTMTPGEEAALFHSGVQRHGVGPNEVKDAEELAQSVEDDENMTPAKEGGLSTEGWANSPSNYRKFNDIIKYRPDQRRDYHGRWTVDGNNKPAEPAKTSGFGARMKAWVKARTTPAALRRAAVSAGVDVGVGLGLAGGAELAHVLVHLSGLGSMALATGAKVAMHQIGESLGVTGQVAKDYINNLISNMIEGEKAVPPVEKAGDEDIVAALMKVRAAITGLK